MTPVYLGYAALKLNSDKSDVATKNKHVRLFIGFRLDKPSALIYNIIFMVRRFIIVIGMIFMTDSPLL